MTTLVLLFAAWLVLFITKGRFLRPWFERTASSQLQSPVRVAGEFNLFFDPFELAFRADGLTIANAPWAAGPNLFEARLLSLRARPLSLVWGKPTINVADIDGAKLTLQWDAQHLHNNWTFPSSKPFELPDIAEGRITDTHIDFTDPLVQLVLKADVSPVSAVNTRITQGLRFAGAGSWHKQPVSFTGRIDLPDQALHAAPSAVVLHVQAADTVVDIAGRMPGISNFSAGQYHLAVRGANIASLFEFIGAAAIPTRRYHLVTEVHRENGDWVFSGIRGTFGDSDLAGQMVMGLRDDRLHIGGALRTESLDLLDAAPALGYDPQRLDRMGTKGLVTHENGHPRILPDTPMQSAELRRFDADVRYHVGGIAGKGFPVEQVDLTLQLDHGVLNVRPLSAVVAGGRLDSTLTLDMRGPEAKADFQLHLHPTRLGTLLTRFGVAESGTTGTMAARIAVRGVGNSLRQSLGRSSGRIAAIIPAGTMSARDIQLSELDLGTFVQRMFQKKLKDPVQINCGLVAFTVNDGRSTADPILIDTAKNIITGNGDFSFRDESVNLQVKARAKKFSLFSLQSPVGVGGYLAQPKVKVISPQLVGRVGAAAALAVVGGPLAALVAFVDPGTGKAATCAPVLAGARSNAQRTIGNKPVEGLSKHRR